MTIAAVLLQRARDFHSAFTTSQTPDAVILRVLDRLRDRLYMDAVQVNRAAFVRLVTVPFTPSLLTTGIPIATSNGVSNVRVLYSSSNDSETLPLLLQDRPKLTLSVAVNRYATVEQAVAAPVAPSTQGLLSEVIALYPKSADRWVDVGAILYDTLPKLTSLTAVSLDTEMPATADDTLVMELVKFMASRGAAYESDAKPDKGWVAREAEDARRTFLEHLGLRRKDKMRQIREGW